MVGPYDDEKGEGRDADDEEVQEGEEPHEARKGRLARLNDGQPGHLREYGEPG
jgi:hypothetical protein